MLTAWVPSKQPLALPQPRALPLLQPFCAWKGLLNPTRGPGAAAAEGHQLSSEFPYPEVLNLVKRLPRILMRSASKGQAKYSFQCHRTVSYMLTVRNGKN